MPTIAQHFSAGAAIMIKRQVPAGTKEDILSAHVGISFLSSPRDSISTNTINPALKRWAIYLISEFGGTRAVASHFKTLDYYRRLRAEI